MAVTHSKSAVPVHVDRIAQGWKENPAILRDTPAFSWISVRAMGSDAAEEAVVKAVNKAVPIIFMKVKRVCA